MTSKLKIFLPLLIVAIIGFTIIAIIRPVNNNITPDKQPAHTEPDKEESKPSEKIVDPPMSISLLRSREYPGENFSVEKTLPDGSNYRQFIVSYKSEGLKIFGLLTIPKINKPEKGYPAIVFVHGYIPPRQYSTVESYPTYQAALARSGFVTFKPDLRGHGDSEGDASGAHFSEKYVVDTMHAISYLKNHESVDPGRLGYWGHSNGGEIGLRTAVISTDIKAFVFWAGVVGSYESMLETYNEKIPFLRDEIDDIPLIRDNGLPSSNSEFWRTIDPYYHLEKISAPIELHHGTADQSVPVELSIQLKNELEKSGKQVDIFQYPGDDHNISRNSNLAWQRTIKFFEDNL